MNISQHGIPIAELHTPDELLDSAEVLYESGNPKFLRPAILEAISALESYVQDTVFTILEETLDPLLMKWVENRTKSDFDVRLSVLTPVAVGIPIDKGSSLWEDYKKSKLIRNKVTHTGVKVTQEDARFVIDTVYRWLTYLGSTIEIEASLLGLKRFIENKNILIRSEEEAIYTICEYYGRTKAAKNYNAISQPAILEKISRRFDAIMSFGDYLVIVETKFYSDSINTENIKEAIEQAKGIDHLYPNKVVIGVLILFTQGSSLQEVEDIIKIPDDRILIAVIKS